MDCDCHYNLHVYNQNFNIRQIIYKWLGLLAVVMLSVFLFALLDASIQQSTDKSLNNISLGLDEYF